jgi:hypothetical protein
MEISKRRSLKARPQFDVSIKCNFSSYLVPLGSFKPSYQCQMTSFQVRLIRVPDSFHFHARYVFFKGIIALWGLKSSRSWAFWSKVQPWKSVSRIGLCANPRKSANNFRRDIHVLFHPCVEVRLLRGAIWHFAYFLNVWTIFSVPNFMSVRYFVHELRRIKQRGSLFEMHMAHAT